MNTARDSQARRPPATVEELLDHEEALAIQQLTLSVQRLGDELCIATDVRARIRRRPYLAIGLGAVLGFVGSPVILRTARRILTATATVRSLTSARSPSIPELVLASLRVVSASR